MQVFKNESVLMAKVILGQQLTDCYTFCFFVDPCGTLHIVYTIYYPQYGLTLLEALGLEDTPTLCLK